MTILAPRATLQTAMASRSGKRTRGGSAGDIQAAQELAVALEHVPTPDAEQRLHHAYTLTWQAAGRADDTETSQTGDLEGAKGKESDDGER